MTETVSQKITDEKKLPEGWAWTTLEKLAVTLKSGGTPSTKRPDFYDGNIPYAKVEDIVNAGKHLYSTKIKITQAGIDNSSAWVVPKDSLLYTMYASYGVPTISAIDVATNQAIIALIPPTALLSLDYLYYYLWSIKSSLGSRIQGTTQANLNAGIVKSIDVPLPPLNEQRRIVEKIEELFTKLDAGVRSLEQARAQLKSYRRSVLKAAVEGELSRELREAHRDELEPASELLEWILQERWEKFAGKKYKEPASSDTSELPALPCGWEWARLQDISDALGGFAFKSKDYSAAGYQIVKIGNVNPGKLNLAERPSYIQSVEPEIVEKYLLQPDDIAISLTGSRGKRDYGFVAPIRQQQNLLLNQRVARLRFSEMLNVQYCVLALQGEHFQNQFFRYETGNVGQGNVGMKAVKETYIPLSPIKEQRFIVEEVERRLSVVDKLEATVEENLKQAGGLRQSILKQAFSGELVPQDPDDEPAAVLLERIREERQATKQKAGKGRRIKTGSTKRDHAEQGGLF